jgi:hypothetical protein
MMKKFLGILLSFILLASHISLIIGTHYCGGEAVESMLMFGESHLSCGMPDMEGKCDHSEKTNNNDISFDNAPCCENEYQTVRVTDEFIKDAALFSFNINFVAAFISTELNPETFSKSADQLYTEYYQPPPGKNLQILLQTFLL